MGGVRFISSCLRPRVHVCTCCMCTHTFAHFWVPTKSTPASCCCAVVASLLHQSSPLESHSTSRGGLKTAKNPSQPPLLPWCLSIWHLWSRLRQEKPNNSDLDNSITHTARFQRPSLAKLSPPTGTSHVSHLIHHPPPVHRHG